MKATIKIEKEGRAWSWLIMDGETILAGGYCRTKRDAQNDADIKRQAIDSTPERLAQ